MSKNSEHHDTYIIPPNFIEGSTLFGGMFKIRNVIEAGVLAAAVGVPVFSLDLSLTVRIIILCLTALPLALFALMGIAGEPLSSYIIAFFKWLKNRRVVGKTEPKEERKKPKPKKEKQPAPENESMLSEIAGVIRKQSAKKKHTEEPRAAETPKQKKPHRRSKADSPFLNPVAEYLPIEKIANGIIYTKDHRYIKLIEVVPINFLLRSAREQRSIIYSFISYLKISPVKIQFKVLTKRADLNKHTEIVHREMEAETDPNCRVLQEDYLMLEITLPCLLPKRKQRQSTEFLIDPLYFTLSQYSDNNELPKFRQCVVCFSHIYSEKFHNRRVRDYDNLELKQLLDVLSTFIMVDDTGLLVDAYNTTEIGEADCTRISVMAKEDFPKWLNEREKSLKTISDF